MPLIAGVAALITAGALGGSDVATLEQLWPGVRDSSEQVFINAEAGITPWGEGSERRVRTVVTRVAVPWLGAHVLYLEEFLHDDPENIRRVLLLELEPAKPPSSAVHVRLFTFSGPRRWVHLDRRPKLLAALRRRDVSEASGCDLLLRRQGEQFVGGTQGTGCVDAREGASRYVEYQLLISEELYWYRRRVLLRANRDLLQEVLGFNWFALNEARLFTCRIDWSASGRIADLRPLARVDLHDQGGRAHLATPDGRRLELALHSQDWPFVADRDALILQLQDQDESVPMASAWAEIDADEISINLGWLKVHCGSMESGGEALWSDASSSRSGSLGGGMRPDSASGEARSHSVRGEV